MSNAIHIERIPVESSMIAAVGYDAENQTLYAEYNSGKIYAYAEVEPYVFDEIIMASSVGRYFRANIINYYADWQVHLHRNIKW